jgi:predicted FMN-binding regulatory protein PaiB
MTRLGKNIYTPAHYRIEDPSVIREEERILRFLNDLAAQNEPTEAPNKYLATTGDTSNFSQPLSFFSITPEKVDASFKLNQNKSREYRESFANSLIETGSPADHAVAEMIRDNL